MSKVLPFVIALVSQMVIGACCHSASTLAMCIMGICIAGLVASLMGWALLRARVPRSDIVILVVGIGAPWILLLRLANHDSVAAMFIAAPVMAVILNMMRAAFRAD